MANTTLFLHGDGELDDEADSVAAVRKTLAARAVYVWCKRGESAALGRKLKWALTKGAGSTVPKRHDRPPPADHRAPSCEGAFCFTKNLPNQQYILIYL